LKDVLILLNYCVIGAVKPGLYDNVKATINKSIENIINNTYPKENFCNANYIIHRFEKLFPNKSKDEYNKVSVG